MIVIVATGGTISGVIGATGQYSAGTSGHELADLVHSARPELPIEVIDFTKKLSFEVTLDEWLDLVRILRRLVARTDVSGVVVTQGTALLEEVPFLAGLFVPATRPIVFTGAMVPASVAGSDGISNLLHAVSVASDPPARNRGPLVVLGGRVLDAALVVKRHRTALSSVGAADDRITAEVDAAGVRWLKPSAVPPKPFETVIVQPNVPLVAMALGAGNTWVDRWANPAGLVVEGFPGGGGVPSEVAEHLLDLARRIPVVLSSRAPNGRLTVAAGGTSGGGALISGGLISAGALTSARARLVVMAALGANPANPHASVAAALRTWTPDRVENRSIH